jgi:uncharacterized protein
LKIVLQLHVQPGAKRSQFAGIHGERMKVRIAAPAADGRANAALIEFLADHYGVPRRNVTIESGLTSRQKRVVIEGAEPWKSKNSSS